MQHGCSLRLCVKQSATTSVDCSPSLMTAAAANQDVSCVTWFILGSSSVVCWAANFSFSKTCHCGERTRKRKRLQTFGDGDQSPGSSVFMPSLRACPWECLKVLEIWTPTPSFKALEVLGNWWILGRVNVKVLENWDIVQLFFFFWRGWLKKNVCLMFVYSMLCYIFVCGLILYSWLEKCFSFEKSFEMTNAHMLLTVTVLKYPHAPDSFEMHTCSWQFWNAHMLLTVLKCPHAADSFEMYTCCWQFWNVHMLLTVWNVHMLLTVLKCTHAPDSFEMCTCAPDSLIVVSWPWVVDMTSQFSYKLTVTHLLASSQLTFLSLS